MDCLWTGWLWDEESRDWLSVCSHADMAMCHRQLIAYADQLGVAMKLTALTPGAKPCWRLE